MDRVVAEEEESQELFKLEWIIASLLEGSRNEPLEGKHSTMQERGGWEEVTWPEVPGCLYLPIKLEAERENGRQVEEKKYDMAISKKEWTWGHQWDCQASQSAQRTPGQEVKARPVPQCDALTSWPDAQRLARSQKRAGINQPGGESKTMFVVIGHEIWTGLGEWEGMKVEISASSWHRVRETR